MDESFWQEFQAWETQASEAWTSLIRSPEFVDLMNRQLEDWLLFKRQLDQQADEMLRSAQLPTRREQEQILRLTRKLEKQVDLLAGRVERLTQAIQS